MAARQIFLLFALLALFIAPQAFAAECPPLKIKIDRANSVHGLKEGKLFAYVDLAAQKSDLTCHIDADIQKVLITAVSTQIATWWKEPRLQPVNKAEVHIISILNKDEYAKANFNSALMHGKIEFTKQGGIIKVEPMTLKFDNLQGKTKTEGKEQSNTELNFNMVVSKKNCGRGKTSVTGLQSKPSIMTRITERLDEHKRKNFINQTVKSHTFHLNYAFKKSFKDGQEIQDISLTLPQAFHDRSTYELSCRVQKDGSELVYRKFKAKLQNQNSEEPSTTILPRACIGTSGQVTLRAEDKFDEKMLSDELKTSIFDAAIWDPKSTIADTADLEMFLPRFSYSAGDKISFYAHAKDGSKPGTLNIVHIGENVSQVAQLKDVKLQEQKITPYSYRDGVNWPVTGEITIPADITSGYYVATLEQDGKASSFPFVIKPKSGDRTKIGIIAATNTWNAYNKWGNGSFYNNLIGKECLNTDYGRLISQHRPTNLPDPITPSAYDDHLFRAEKQIAQWLEQNGLNYVIYSEDDLDANPKILDTHAIIILPSHPEYYTKKMFDGIARYVKAGGNLINLGGNALNTYVTRVGDLMEKHEDGRRQDLDGEFGGFWSSYLGRSPAAILGTEYDARDYDTYFPYKVLQADNPIFANTGLKNGDTFGDQGSGREMDVKTDKAPVNVIVLAKGTNPKGFGADMVVFNTKAGGKVFSVGSISFAYALVRDEKLGLVLKNVINMMLKK